MYIEDIYFFEVNTKYICIECGEKISTFHECIARVKMLIFSPHKMKNIWYLPKKSKFPFYFLLNGNTDITALLFTLSFDLTFAVCLLGITLGANIVCT